LVRPREALLAGIEPPRTHLDYRAARLRAPLAPAGLVQSCA